jgi:protein phosphatase
LLSAFYKADDRVRELQSSTYPEMGATVAAVIITGNELLHLYSGDCRLYHFNGGKAPYVSHDHSIVRAMVDAGTISESEAAVHPMRNIVTSCIGGPTRKVRLTVDPQLVGSVSSEPQFAGPFRWLASDDIIVMCSDGLWSGINDDDLTETVMRGAVSRMGSDELSNTLVQLALSGAAADNITGIVLDGDVWNTDFYRSDN